MHGCSEDEAKREKKRAERERASTSGSVTGGSPVRALPGAMGMGMDGRPSSSEDEAGLALANAVTEKSDSKEAAEKK